MSRTDSELASAAVAELARAAPGLELLVLFGSRARGDAYDGSDWDFAYLGTGEFDPDAFLARLVPLLGAERVDLVDLARANGLLRYRVAGEGKVLHEAASDLFARFWLEAVTFWCDVEPVLHSAYDEVLARER